VRIFEAPKTPGTSNITVTSLADPTKTASATVTITADGQKVATVVADDRGEWVILPPNKLAPGNHQIGITSVLGGAPPVPSDDVVVVVVPQPQVASNATTGAGGTQTAATNNFSAGTAFNNISFSSGASAFW